jgi:hypothetical protein
VLGGSPIDYLKLKKLVVKMLSLPDTASDVVVNQVKDHFQSALSDTFNKNVLNSSSTTKHIINIFKEKKTTKLP